MSATTNAFQMLRARVERSLKPPYVLVISSALPNDGKDVCARGLADGMSFAGHRTLLIDIDHDTPSFDELVRPSSLASAANAYDFERAVAVDPRSGTSLLSLAHSNLPATCSMESVAAFLTFARSKFEAVVIEAAPLARSSIGTLFAAQCDAVIVTTRERRSVRAEDRELVDIIEREAIEFFGVVTIGRREIVASAKSTRRTARARSMDASATASAAV